MFFTKRASFYILVSQDLRWKNLLQEFQYILEQKQNKWTKHREEADKRHHWSEPFWSSSEVPATLNLLSVLWMLCLWYQGKIYENKSKPRPTLALKTPTSKSVGCESLHNASFHLHHTVYLSQLLHWRPGTACGVTTHSSTTETNNNLLLEQNQQSIVRLAFPNWRCFLGGSTYWWVEQQAKAVWATCLLSGEEQKKTKGYLQRKRRSSWGKKIKDTEKGQKRCPSWTQSAWEEIKKPAAGEKMLCPEYTALHQNTSDCELKQPKWWLISFSQLTYCISVATKEVGIAW